MGIRADQALITAGLSTSRSRSKEMITNGSVMYDGKPVKKASELIEDPSLLSLNGDVLPYVSRGGLKLEKALKAFNVDINGKICADIGASTGGFTDCLLQNGASYVYAVDCGHGQLSDRLIEDVRVENREGVNARYMLPEDFDKKIDLVTCDASFISLLLLLPAMNSIASKDGELICLIKPQFEAGREALNKKGVVKNKKDHITVIEKILSFAADLGLGAADLSFSPIKGPEGNTEYLVHFKKNSKQTITLNQIIACVEEAM